MIFSPLSFSDYGAQCCPIPAFSSSVEISGPQVAALKTLVDYVSVREKWEDRAALSSILANFFAIFQ